MHLHTRRPRDSDDPYEEHRFHNDDSDVRVAAVRDGSDCSRVRTMRKWEDEGVCGVVWGAEDP